MHILRVTLRKALSAAGHVDLTPQVRSGSVHAMRSLLLVFSLTKNFNNFNIYYVAFARCWMWYTVCHLALIIIINKHNFNNIIMIT